MRILAKHIPRYARVISAQCTVLIDDSCGCSSGRVPEPTSTTYANYESDHRNPDSTSDRHPSDVAIGMRSPLARTYVMTPPIVRLTGFFRMSNHVTSGGEYRRCTGFATTLPRSSTPLISKTSHILRSAARPPNKFHLVFGMAPTSFVKKRKYKILSASAPNRRQKSRLSSGSATGCGGFSDAPITIRNSGHLLD